MKNQSYFSIEELSRSFVAKQQHIDNTPPPDVLDNMQRLIDKVLNPARVALGEPIVVNSGYRCPKLNAAVGGKRKSFHLHGRAADLSAGSHQLNRKLFEILKKLPHVELINEHDYTWIHVAL